MSTGIAENSCLMKRSILTVELTLPCFGVNLKEWTGIYREYLFFTVYDDIVLQEEKP